MSAGDVAITALVVLGVAVITIGVLGVWRLPDVYNQLHAASKAVFLGVIALLAASMIDGTDGGVTKPILIAVFLGLTTPITSHVIAKSAHRTGEPSYSDTFDESGLDADDVERAGEGRDLRPRP